MRSAMGRADHGPMRTHIARLLEQQRSVLLQPYLDRVDEQGETALIYFEGQYSHAIRKGRCCDGGARRRGRCLRPRSSRRAPRGR